MQSLRLCVCVRVWVRVQSADMEVNGSAVLCVDGSMSGDRLESSYVFFLMKANLLN